MTASQSRFAIPEIRHAELERTITAGSVAGIVAAVPAILLLVVAGGGYLPLYAIAGVVDPTPLTSAVTAASHGHPVEFFQYPFTAGLAMCLTLGAVSGVVFMAVVRRRKVTSRRLLLLYGSLHGLVFGLVAFYLGLLPTLGLVLDVRWPAPDLVQLVGWPALVGANALHGVVLGAWAAWRVGDLSARDASA